MKVGVFPIINHYYEPLFDVQQIKHSLSDERDLPGIEWNIKEQLEILDSFRLNDELNNVQTSHYNDGYTFPRFVRPESCGRIQWVYLLCRER